MERMPSDRMEEWFQDLDAPLEWQTGDTMAGEQAESDSFFNMMRKTGGA